MSDKILKVIPKDPEFVPNPEVFDKARSFIGTIIPIFEAINIIIENEIVFVDQGQNFDSVLCPFCGADLIDFWGEAMDNASLSNFSDLNIQVPCCNSRTTLNDLKYVLPAGFAKYIVEIKNPKIESLKSEDIENLGEIMGCPLKQIYGHY